MDAIRLDMGFARSSFQHFSRIAPRHFRLRLHLPEPRAKSQEPKEAWLDPNPQSLITSGIAAQGMNKRELVLFSRLCLIPTQRTEIKEAAVYMPTPSRIPASSIPASRSHFPVASSLPALRRRQLWLSIHTA